MVRTPSLSPEGLGLEPRSDQQLSDGTAALNSHYLTFTFLLGICWENVLFKLGSKRVNGLSIFRYTISAWEIKGQPDQHTGLQCLLSARTLYLLIYDVSRGTQEIEELRPWLLSLQACAPDASVMLVGTHSDRVAKERKAALLQDITDNALRMCSAPGFPQVKVK